MNCIVCGSLTSHRATIYKTEQFVPCCNSHEHTSFYYDDGVLKPMMMCARCYGPTMHSEEKNGINQAVHGSCEPILRPGCRYCKNDPTHKTDDGFLECDVHKPPILKRCGSIEYRTPSDVINDIHEMWGHIALDPATAPSNPTRAHSFYEANGHKLPWQDRTFCNPPYGKMIKAFLVHAATQAALRYRIALLLPCGPRNSSIYFQKFVFTEHLTGILMFNKRLNFGPGPAPQASMLCLYNCSRSEARKLAHHGVILGGLL